MNIEWIDIEAWYVYHRGIVFRGMNDKNCYYMHDIYDQCDDDDDDVWLRLRLNTHSIKMCLLFKETGCLHIYIDFGVTHKAVSSVIERNDTRLDRISVIKFQRKNKEII